MSLELWKANGWLKPHQTDKEQITDLLAIPGHTDDADYLETCRAKRNTAEYDVAGTISQSEADELREFARKLHGSVLAWLRQNHPSLAD